MVKAVLGVFSVLVILSTALVVGFAYHDLQRSECDLQLLEKDVKCRGQLLDSYELNVDCLKLSVDELETIYALEDEVEEARSTADWIQNAWATSDAWQTLIGNELALIEVETNGGEFYVEAADGRRLTPGYWGHTYEVGTGEDLLWVVAGELRRPLEQVMPGDYVYLNANYPDDVLHRPFKQLDSLQYQAAIHGQRPQLQPQLGTGYEDGIGNVFEGGLAALRRAGFQQVSNIPVAGRYLFKYEGNDLDEVVPAYRWRSARSDDGAISIVRDFSPSVVVKPSMYGDDATMVFDESVGIQSFAVEWGEPVLLVSPSIDRLEGPVSPTELDIIGFQIVRYGFQEPMLRMIEWTGSGDIDQPAGLQVY